MTGKMLSARTDMLREYGELDGFMGVGVVELEESTHYLVVMVRDEECNAYKVINQLGTFDNMPIEMRVVGNIEAQKDEY